MPGAKTGAGAGARKGAEAGARTGADAGARLGAAAPPAISSGGAMRSQRQTAAEFARSHLMLLRMLCVAAFL